MSLDVESQAIGTLSRFKFCYFKTSPRIFSKTKKTSNLFGSVLHGLNAMGPELLSLFQLRRELASLLLPVVAVRVKVRAV